MFEHLDDHNPGRTGTGAQLAGVRNRAREITRSRRRSQLAVGSVTLTAAASVSGVAVLTGAGPLRHLEGQAAGGSGATPTAAAPKPGLAPGSAERPGQSAGVPGSNALDAQKSPAPGTGGSPPSGDGRGTCAASQAVPSEAPPQGYVTDPASTAKDEAPSLAVDGGFHRADGQAATVKIKITCSEIPVDDRTTSDKRTVTPIRVAGHDGYLWHAAGEAGVEWTAADHTSVYVVANGADGVRLSDAELEAYAATLPAT